MATSIDEIRGYLDECDLRYRVDDEEEAILIGFRVDPQTSTYRTPDGEPHVRIVIRVLEGGDFVEVFSPNAWNILGSLHKAAVFETLASIQSRYKMLRFDYDPADGEIRPNIELPLEDAGLTSRQFHRLLQGVLHGTQRYDRAIRLAADAGEISAAALADDDSASPADASLGDLMHLADRAGGIDALERLIGGDDAPEDGRDVDSGTKPR
jgi:hypothetical protein